VAVTNGTEVHDVLVDGLEYTAADLAIAAVALPL